ncbi:hypothetical protein M885DRAFT_565967 [Pelagophyceae sp. CCMP2097]|nr:hypothetical protein M885DRAFT_565967 [Pelagophyceae sp. CCMP2097]
MVSRQRAVKDEDAVVGFAAVLLAAPFLPRAATAAAAFAAALWARKHVDDDFRFLPPAAAAALKTKLKMDQMDKVHR